MKSCCKITDTGIISISQHCRELQLLDLSCCSNYITDTSITLISQYCIQITVINFTWL